MTTRRKLAAVLATASIATGMLGITAASAAHCTAPGDHAQANTGNNGHNEGDHQGWSTCVEQAEENRQDG